MNHACPSSSVSVGETETSDAVQPFDLTNDFLADSDDSEFESEDVAETKLEETSSTEKRLNIVEIREKLSTWQCCQKRKCCAKFTASEILEHRRILAQERHQVDKRFKLKQLVPLPGEDFKLSGIRVCEQFFRYAVDMWRNMIDQGLCYSFAVGASNTLVYKVRGSEPQHYNRGDRPSVKANAIISFLDALCKYGEQQPDSRDVHLSQPSKRMVYSMYGVSHRDLPVSYVYFLQCWHDYRPTIKVRKIQRSEISCWCTPDAPFM